MKKLSLLCLAGCALILVGCKTKVYAPVTHSEIYGDPKLKMATLAVQVPSCTDSTDKFESSSVIKAKQRVPYIFPKAEYDKCYREDFDSYATFNIPFQVGGDADQCKPDQVCIYHSKNGVWANVRIGKEILDKTKEVTDSKINGNDLQLVLLLDNDSGSELPMFVPASFVEGNAYYKTNITLKKDSTKVPFMLGNVGTGWVLNGNFASLFGDLNKAKELDEKTKK